MPTASIPQAFELALRHHQAGRLGDAEALYRQILAAQPTHAEALHHLGVIAHQAGRHDLAAEWIHRALVLNPNNPAAHFNLGEACRTADRGDEAITHFRRALQLKPDYPEAHLNLGCALRERGDFDEAVASFHRAIGFRPTYPEAYYNLGNTFRERGQCDEAVAAYRRVLELKPDSPEAWNNLGVAQIGQGQFNEAVKSYRRALQLKPNYLEALSNLGGVLRERGEFDEAIAAYRRLLELKPGHAEAHYDLGNTLRQRGQFGEAIPEYRRALELKADWPEACNNLGIALARQGQLDEAAAAYRRALELKPEYPEARNNLGGVLVEQGQLDDAIAEFRDVLRLNPNQAWAHSNLIYTLHFHPRYDDGMIAQEQEHWNRQFGDPFKCFVKPQANDWNPERRLRIGYVSPYFRDHVVGRNLLPLLENHDHGNFEILCYADMVRSDSLSKAFRECAGQWHNVAGMSDEALAEKIGHDGVDILVDLTQHMEGNRLPMFARHPAPVQVSFAGYPASTGLDAIEYRISDRYLEEGGERMKDEGGRMNLRSSGPFSPLPHSSGTEQVCLIDSFWCYDPCGAEVSINGLPAREKGFVSFGSLNNFCKVNEPLLRLWARVLGEVEDSRLILRSALGSHRRRTLEVLEQAGVEARRVEFLELLPRQAYLETYHRLDIVLDTFPYNGHTTNLDALWMGVPVVSLAGKQPVSRAGLSQLSNLGLPELVAFTEDDYVRMARQLARDLPRLAELRTTLRSRMEASPLMDAPRFARNIEAAYRAMWRQWCTEPLSLPR